MESTEARIPRAALFAVVLLAVGAIAYLLRDVAMPTTPSRESANETGSPTTTTPLPATATPGADPATPESLVRADADRPVADAADFAVRGRCVDDAGHPLADCTVALAPHPSLAEAFVAWRREHPDRELPAALLATTGPDGTFALACAANAAFAFGLRATRADLVPAEVALDPPAPGAAIDVGDAVLHRGVRIVGTVQCDDGTPCVATRVVVQEHSTSRRPREHQFDLAPSRAGETRTRADGSFEFADLVLPGTWHLDATAAGPHAMPFRVETSLARPVETVHVVVGSALPDLAIAGRVVDERGAPIAGATVVVRARAEKAKAKQTKTDENGAFAVVPTRADDLTPANVRASKAGAGSIDEVEQVAWGTRDLVLVAYPLPALEVRVTDAAGRPILAYSPHVDRATAGPTSMRPAKATPSIAAPGPYADGVARFEACPTGRLRVLVDFADDSGFAPVHADVEVARRGTTRAALVADRGAELGLRLVDGSSRPVAGATLVVAELHAESLDRDTVLVDLRGASTPHTASSAFALATRVTDPDGRVHVRVPTGRRLGVFAPGPKHVPLRLDLGAVAADTERTIEVQCGARLFGRLGPPAALAALRRRAGVREGAEWKQYERPLLRLAPAGAPPTHTSGAFRTWPSFFAGEDGTFDVRALAAGEYEVRLQAYQTKRDVPLQTFEPTLARVVLRDGDETEVDLTIEVPVPVRRTLHMTQNGKPIAGAWSTIQCDPPLHAETNASGTVVVAVAPGLYDVRIFAPFENGNVQLRAAAPLDLRLANGPNSIDVEFPASHVRLRVLEHDGRPVVGCGLHLACTEVADLVTAFPVTDAEGRTQSWIAAGTHAIEAVRAPEPNADEFARARAAVDEEVARRQAKGQVLSAAEIELRTATAASAFASKRSVRVALGTRAFATAVEDEIELRLPAR